MGGIRDQCCLLSSFAWSSACQTATLSRPVVDTTADSIAVGGEAALIKFFIDGLGTQWRNDLIGYNPATNSVVQQADMPFGGADIVILHGDGFGHR